MVTRTIERGAVQDIVRFGGPRTARKTSNIREVSARHLNKPNPGQRSTALHLNISRSSVQRILKQDLNLMPYHKTRTSRVTELHIEARLASAKILLRKYERNRRSKYYNWDNVTIIDFCGKNGIQQKTNSKNNVVYACDRQPILNQLLHVSEEKFEKGFMLWGGISSRGLIPETPLFIDEFLDQYQWNRGEKKTINADRYIDSLE